LLKYPWLRHPSGHESRKWGAYTSEEKELRWARAGHLEHEHIKSLEAAIMDWADDIAYSVHDIEDFYKAGLIPLDRIFADRELQCVFIDNELIRSRREAVDRAELEAAFDELRPLVPTMYDGSSLHRAQLKQFSSQLVSRYISSVRFVDGEVGEKAIDVDRAIRNQVTLLKGLIWQYVIGTQSLSAQRYGQRALIRSLFNTFAEAVQDDGHRDIFPTLTKERLELSETFEERLRIAADSIASMTEAQVVDVHQRLTGIGLGSAMDRALL
jgi:dGTPase